MAHEIAQTAAGKASIAYVGEVPWHGLGQSLLPGATMEEWAVAAGFDWEVKKADVTFVDANGVTRTVPGKDVLYRSDTGAPISVMSERYREVQPRQVLDFFADVCNGQGWSMETAGVLRGGARYWALAKVGLNADLGTGTADQHLLYMLLATSADGSLATVAQATDVRVVCQNTLSMSLHGKAKGRRVKIRHASVFDAAKVKRELGMVDFVASWDAFIDAMKAMGEVKVTEEQATEYFGRLLRPSDTRTARQRDLEAASFADLLSAPAAIGEHTAVFDGVIDLTGKPIRNLDAMLESYHSAPGAEPGTVYGLLQGATHYIDHARGKAGENRLTSAWFGQGANMKATAMQAALALATPAPAAATLN